MFTKCGVDSSSLFLLEGGHERTATHTDTHTHKVGDATDHTTLIAAI